MSGQSSSEGVQRLRSAFLRLIAFEALAGLAAVLLLTGYFGFRLSWCLPAFAVALIAAAAAQVIFIGQFRKSYSGGA